MSYVNIRSALIQGAKQGLTAAGLSNYVRWPNAILQPPANSPWVSVDLLFSDPSVASLGSGGEDEHTGVLQFGLHFPLQSGDNGVIEAYDALRTFFVAGRFLAFQDTTVTVLSCGMSPPMPKNEYFQSFVTVYWRCRLNRPTL